MQKLIKQQTPNKFLAVPSISKKVWDYVQSRHFKTLLMSVLHPVSKDDENPALYKKMMEEIYFTGGPTTPLHLKIVMWRKEKARLGIKSPLALSNLKCLLIPRQKFLKQYDAADDQPVDELRELVKSQLEFFEELCAPDDQSFRSLKQDQLLDINDSFVHLYYHGKDWSAVDLACTCKHCYQWTVCADNVLVAMCFDSTLRVPDACVAEWVLAAALQG
jgi:hypothetical protein